MLFDMIDQYRGLPRQVYIILIARVVAATGAFVYPFITMLLSSRLGFSDQKVSYYLLILAVSYVPSALLGGKLADKFSRKYVYICAMLCTDVCFIIGGFFCDRLAVVYFILVGYFCMNMGSPVMAAMMMDITNPKNRQESMSLCYLGLNLGIAVGPLIAGFLFENYTSWIFWGEGIINACAMLIIGFGVKDSRPGKEELAALAADSARLGERGGEGSLFREVLDRPVIIIFAVIGICYAFAYSQMSYVMPLHLADVFGIASGSKYVGIIWSLNGLSVFVMTPLVVLLFKKNHPLLNVSLAGIGYAVGFGMYAFTQNIILIFALVAVWSAGEVMAAANCGVFIANNAPATHRARFQSIYDIIQGTGRAVGPMLMGAFLVSHSFSAAWILAASICLAAMVGYYILYRYCIRQEGAVSADKADENQEKSEKMHMA